MKRICKYICTFVLSFLYMCNFVFAADYTISVTSNSVTVGNTVTLKINASSLTGRFDISSSNSSVVSVSPSFVWTENNTQSINLKANKVGTAVITVTPKEGVSDTTGSEPKLTSKQITITVKEKVVEKPKPKSSNNLLSSLTIEGYQLDSSFQKEVLEYTATVKEGTEKIKINAQLADSKAKVTGIGEVAVTEGLNTIEIIVTAENGSKRTYTLKVTVKEYEPINVNTNNNQYTVVRKRKDLPEISDYFIEKDITIGDNVFEGYYNEKLNYEVVGLKNPAGNISYYIYKDDTYTKYNEQIFNGTVLQITNKELNGGFKKTTFTYNGAEIDSYQEVKLDIIKNTYALDNNDIEGNQFYLFYAINLDTGKEELYQYDLVEKTVQRYNTLILDMYKKQSDTYYLYLLCSILVLGVTIITFSTIVICGNKKRKKLKKKLSQSQKEEYNEELPIKKAKSTRNPKSKKRIEKDLELD